jgi:hypothetical protein
LNIPKRNPGGDVEVDALAVVDGKLYLCEGKSSAGLSIGEIDQLVLAAERIRPDVVLVACFEQATDGLRRSIETLRQRVRDFAEVELITNPPHK